MGIPQSQTDKILEAPEEIKKVFSDLYNSKKRFEKAQRQAELWEKELEFSAKEICFMEAKYEEAAGRWDRENNTMKPDERVELSL